jgi:hypothetical protein
MARKHLECDELLNVHMNIQTNRGHMAKEAKVSLNMFPRHTCSMFAIDTGKV